MKENNNQHKTPFFTKLCTYSKTYVAPFDVPGHKRGGLKTDLTKKLGSKVFEFDSNSPRGLDTLSRPTGVIKEAQDLAAKAFNSDYAYFITGGTTLSIQAMIMASVKANEKIIMPRNVHKSVINSLILSGGIPIFIKPIIDPKLQIAVSISTTSVIKAIDSHKDAKALFLINPTYYGGTCDLKTIIEYAHSKNIIVLVDEAHGGNLYFGENLPITAMEAGADFSAVSIHKTNLSLTQSSILLQKGTRVSINRITATINILQSTSPSQLLIASLDTSRKYMFLNGRKEIEKLLFLSQKYIELLNQIPGISVKSKDHFIAVGTHDYDRTKLLIDVSKLSISGFDVYKLLADKYNVQIELAEESIILCVLSIAQHEKDFEYLLYGLKEISKQFYSLQEYYYPKIPLNYPKRCLRPRVAYHAPSITININDSLDEICAESIMVYPPGIPLIIPGEKIDLKIISSINNYIKNNLILLSESDLGKIKVVDKTRWSRKQKGEAYENQK